MEFELSLMMNYRKYYEIKKGIKLRPDWDIHHIDFERNNNHIDNLYAMPSIMHKHLHQHLGYCDREELDELIRSWVFKSINCLELDSNEIKNPNKLPNIELTEEQGVQLKDKQLDMFD
jgi:hypothetical protein